MVTALEALQGVSGRILRALEARGGREGDVVLVAVSKGFAADAVRSLAAAGQKRFGESYVQEAIAKIAALHDLPLEWHFIGPIQSNKTRAIAAHFDWVQSVDRESIARRLSDQRPGLKGILNVLLQINISAEGTKQGVEPASARNLADAVRALPRLRLRGLMAIPRPVDGAVAREEFRRMHGLFDDLNAAGYGLDTLSMGMSADLEDAIAEGATMVRLGTALFGNRLPRG